MNLLHVICSMNPSTGGPSQELRYMVPALIKSGVNTCIVSLDDPQASFLKHDNIPIHAIGKGNGKWQYQRKLLPWLHNNIDKFDIVVIHGLWLFHGYAVFRALRKQKIKNKNNKVPKLFIKTHGMLDPYFQKAKKRSLKAIRNWIYWKLIESKIVNNADGVLFGCMDELILARKTFRPYHPKKELNVGYTVAPPPVYKAVQKTAFMKKCFKIENSSYIIFLSRINEKKGIDLVIKAYILLKRRYSLPKLLIAGPGLDSRYGRQIKKLASGIDDILFSGMLTGDAKWGALYGSDAFILPSHQENFGIAIVEAIACGKPVLISNKVNIWKEIETGGGGIVADDTLEGTLQLLERWYLMNESEKEKMRVASKQTFRNHFAVEKTAINFLNIIAAKNNFEMQTA